MRPDERFKVEHRSDREYEVFEWLMSEINETLVHDWKSVFQGDICECEAYIRLNVDNFIKP